MAQPGSTKIEVPKCPLSCLGIRKQTRTVLEAPDVCLHTHPGVPSLAATLPMSPVQGLCTTPLALGDPQTMDTHGMDIPWDHGYPQPPQPVPLGPIGGSLKSCPGLPSFFQMDSVVCLVLGGGVLSLSRFQVLVKSLSNSEELQTTPAQAQPGSCVSHMS